MKTKTILPALVAIALYGAPCLADPPPGDPPPGDLPPAPPTTAPPAQQPRVDVGATSEPRVPTDDPTGGAYTSPTLLFIPAGALPTWNVRATLSSELQGPSDVDAGFRPGVGLELGLPAGFTLGAGTNWVGGDVNADTGRTDFNLGLSPFAQLRFHIFGAKDGLGFQLGVAGTYKFVGFEGDPGEGEIALSAQYRMPKYEVGLQAVGGKDFASRAADVEAHAYALYRIIPQLGVGAAGQVRVAVVSDDEADSSYDALGGAIASLTLGRYQVGALAGASTLGLAQGQAGALGQLFGTARF